MSHKPIRCKFCQAIPDVCVSFEKASIMMSCNCVPSNTMHHDVEHLNNYTYSFDHRQIGAFVTPADAISWIEEAEYDAIAKWNNFHKKPLSYEEIKELLKSRHGFDNLLSRGILVINT